MSVVLLISNFLLLLGGIKALIAGIAFLAVATYVSLCSPEQLQRHPRLRKLRDRHIGEMFATGVMFTAFATAILIRVWFDSGAEPGQLEMGLMRGFLVIFVLGGLAVFLLRITSKLRD